jgi:hypothetical protein
MTTQQQQQRQNTSSSTAASAAAHAHVSDDMCRMTCVSAQVVAGSSMACEATARGSGVGTRQHWTMSASCRGSSCGSAQCFCGMLHAASASAA